MVSLLQQIDRFAFCHHRLPPPIGVVDRPIPAAGSGCAPPPSPFPQEVSTFFHFHPFSQKKGVRQVDKLKKKLRQEPCLLQDDIHKSPVLIFHTLLHCLMYRSRTVGVGQLAANDGFGPSSYTLRLSEEEKYIVGQEQFVPTESLLLHYTFRLLEYLLSLFCSF
ncbi:hypothetical protein L2E82_05068 [Cichorium intybus]|uniref:Uncharacterized protein n=1 Tax=Cichorium intybus TaxID=13427 RepID=A0ACB9H620_CICIN|nr:hypothetical protein L2E82_05068 [Cichorium intybus]